MNLLTEHRDVLDAIADTLIENEKIDGNEMLQLIQKIKPQLVTEEALKTVSEIVRKTAKTAVDAAVDATSLDDNGPEPATAQ